METSESERDELPLEIPFHCDLCTFLWCVWFVRRAF